MSEGLANIANAHIPTVTLAGKTYRLEVKGLRGYGEREAYIYSLKACPFEAIDRFPELPNPKPIIKGKNESDAEYAVRRQEWSEQKDRYQSRLLLRNQLIDKAMAMAVEPRVVTMEEDAKFDQSYHGIGYNFWKAAEPHHPEITCVQDALDIIDGCKNTEFFELRRVLLRIVEEEDLIKNSDGPDQSDGPKQSTEQLSENDFHGASSTTTLQPSTNGPSITSTL